MRVTGGGRGMSMKSEPTNQQSRRLTSNSSGTVSMAAVVHSVTSPRHLASQPPSARSHASVSRA